MRWWNFVLFTSEWYSFQTPSQILSWVSNSCNDSLDNKIIDHFHPIQGCHFRIFSSLVAMKYIMIYSTIQMLFVRLLFTLFCYFGVNLIGAYIELIVLRNLKDKVGGTRPKQYSLQYQKVQCVMKDVRQVQYSLWYQKIQ